MLLSMTGFSSDHVDIKLSKGRSISLAIELKTLNARFFESSIRLPNSLSFLETDCISLLKSKLIRGRTFLTIYPVIQVFNQSGNGFLAVKYDKFLVLYLCQIDTIKVLVLFRRFGFHFCLFCLQVASTCLSELVRESVMLYQGFLVDIQLQIQFVLSVLCSRLTKD